MSKPITTRLIWSEDLPMLMAHRNEPDTRGFLEHGDEVNMEQQERWFQTIVTKDVDVYRIAQCDGEDIGLIRVTWINQHEKNACVGADVFSRWRGQGFGHRLFQKACEVAIDQGATRELYLWVFLDNAKAVRIYEKAGFVKTNSSKELRGRQYVKMTKSLWI